MSSISKKHKKEHPWKSGWYGLKVSAVDYAKLLNEYKDMVERGAPVLDREKLWKKIRQIENFSRSQKNFA